MKEFRCILMNSSGISPQHDPTPSRRSPANDECDLTDHQSATPHDNSTKFTIFCFFWLNISLFQIHAARSTWALSFAAWTSRNAPRLRIDDNIPQDKQNKTSWCPYKKGSDALQYTIILSRFPEDLTLKESFSVISTPIAAMKLISSIGKWGHKSRTQRKTRRWGFSSLTAVDECFQISKLIFQAFPLYRLTWSIVAKKLEEIYNLKIIMQIKISTFKFISLSTEHSYFESRKSALQRATLADFAIDLAITNVRGLFQDWLFFAFEHSPKSAICTLKFEIKWKE